MREGSGLGLAIVKHIVRAHRGRDSASRARPARGPTFRIVLPSPSPPWPPRRRPRRALPPKGDGRVNAHLARRPPWSRRVLVVEDDPSIALGLRINLEGEGYRVLSADDGEQRARDGARASSPDLVILDVMLPKMNGLEVLQTLRREGLHDADHRAVSARTGEMDKVTGLELGAEDYVAKPFSLAELLARVRAALRRGPRAPELGAAIGVRASATSASTSRARTVTRAGAPVEITATEFDVLMCLVEARGARAHARGHLPARLGAEPPRDAAHDRQLHPAAPRQARGRPAAAAALPDGARRRLPLRRVSRAGGSCYRAVQLPPWISNLLRSYLATVYEFPTPTAPLRASLDGDIVADASHAARSSCSARSRSSPRTTRARCSCRAR